MTTTTACVEKFATSGCRGSRWGGATSSGCIADGQPGAHQDRQLGNWRTVQAIAAMP